MFGTLFDFEGFVQLLTHVAKEAEAERKTKATVEDKDIIEGEYEVVEEGETKALPPVREK